MKHNRLLIQKCLQVLGLYIHQYIILDNYLQSHWCIKLKLAGIFLLLVYRLQKNLKGILERIFQLSIMSNSFQGINQHIIY